MEMEKLVNSDLAAKTMASSDYGNCILLKKLQFSTLCQMKVNFQGFYGVLLLMFPESHGKQC